jgi:predicted mannosyl-3-phosphoglycerate phosphatase (HAD superfamily)
VLCSSQTRAELELRQQDLGIRHPFVSESGSAAFIPLHYFGFDVPSGRKIAGYDTVEFGSSYEDVARRLHRVAARLRIEIVAFSDMSVDEVARDCGLPLLHARLAKLREYQEVFRLREPHTRARTRLRKALQAARLQCVERGRYDYVGDAVSATRGVGLLMSLYRRVWRSIFTVAVVPETAVDSLHSLVDYPVRIPREGLAFGAPDVTGWAVGLAEMLRKLNRTDEEEPPAFLDAPRS